MKKLQHTLAGALLLMAAATTAQTNWKVYASHSKLGFAVTPLLAEEKVRELDVRELNRMLKDMTYTASRGILNGPDCLSPRMDR